MTPVLVLIVMAAGAVAGALGALLGIGGGVFLVPFLNIGLGLPYEISIATSLMTVIATSSAVSAGTTGKNLINLRLGMLLEVGSAAGGLIAALTLEYLTKRQLYFIFAGVTVAISAIMVSRLDRRNVMPPSVDPGVLGGRFIDETGHEVVYRTKRLPVALAASFFAGNISGILGIGGGILKVPALNAWCGVPMRAAAATSALMIGVTAVSSVPVYYARGFINPPLAAAAVLGVLAGSRAGLHFAGRSRARWLKLLMASVLLAVSAIYFFRAL
ncbi:MAG: hypothetical protein A3H96_03275 [Acidobacteria bacterium RIFCSPLOWO2_02_FULL_67_36]|nr:MAG: hypothetical protein A3H96_03275 [Acidobacteria bacterium RIFCSPLOWO2_02_FULL_67_36]